MTTTRRGFLAGSAAAAAARAVAGGDARDGLPAWANAQIDAAVARYRAWKGRDETVAFTFVTDLHSRLASAPVRPDFSDPRFHVLFAQAAADRAGCDFLVDGGDHDYENGCASDAEAFARMAVAEGVYRDYVARPVLFCLGNHDRGPALGRAARPITSARFGEAFNGLAARHGFAVVFGENRSWGFYDVPGKRFRAIFCNTSDGASYGFSKSQLDFVAQALATLPPDGTAAVFGHFCVFTEIGHWKKYQTGCEAKGRAAFMAILEDFARTRPNALAGYFCGDSHFDNEMELRGVNWTISQGYGGIDRANKPWGARTVARDRAREMLFELVAVKPAAGAFRLFRVGAGGAACDRVCSYFNRP